MIEGAMRHGTTMEVQGNYVDSHGQSEVGFGITRLLGFDLLPRIKRINKTRLYRPGAGEPDRYPALEPALTRPVRWELIGEQYDQMIRYATAIRSGIASTEAILRRSTRARSMHATYQAMIEVGRAQRTVFVARYLRAIRSSGARCPARSYRPGDAPRLPSACRGKRPGASAAG